MPLLLVYSFLLLVVMPGATNGVLAPSGKSAESFPLSMSQQAMGQLEHWALASMSSAYILPMVM